MTLRTHEWPSIVLAALVAASAISGSDALAYPAYSEDPDKNTGYCAACHGDFDGGDYTSQQDGTPWGDNLMDAHRSWLNNDCVACHQSPGSVPVVLNDSGSATFPQSCAGCHGRNEDAGTDTGQPVEHPISLAGAGLRQHHFNAGVAVCATCHGDSEPANYTTVGEDILPFNYATGALSPAFNADPCMDNQFGPTGLDNDGDIAYDQDDPDCSAIPLTPGEASGSSLPPLLVTGKTESTISISYGKPCEATDHRIHFGPLGQVSSYFYTGTRCNLGDLGSFTWTPPGALTEIFFVVVGNNDTHEGSYGIDSGGNERPASPVGSICELPQDLANRCDP